MEGRRRLSTRLSEALVVWSSLSLIAWAPFTKVEESFNLHAVGDIVSLGFDPSALARYDHVTFPGAVPRSVVPALLLSGATWPVLEAGHFFNLWPSDFTVQILIRTILSLVNSFSFIFLARRVRKAFGHKTAKYMMWITATQFHLMFWSSRTLPNSMALPFVSIAFGLLIKPRPPKRPAPRNAPLPPPFDVLLAFVLLSFAAIVIRLELVALIAPLALDVYARGIVTFHTLAVTGLTAAGVCLALSIGVDRIFWRTSEPLWPEGAAAYFNVVQGHSTEWGTSPFHAYFTSHLPRLLHLSFPLAFLSSTIDRRARRLAFPCLFYILALSLLKHKEWRFVIYALPPLNICAAQGVQALQSLFSRRLKLLALTAILTLNLVALALGTMASRSNYPGGQAASWLLNERIPQRAAEAGTGTLTGEMSARGRVRVRVNVHVDAKAAMTGASNFVLASRGANEPWYLSQSDTAQAAAGFEVEVSKAEDLSPVDLLERFDYRLVDADATGASAGAGASGNIDQRVDGGDWDTVRSFDEFAGFGLSLARGLEVKRKEGVKVLERRGQK